VLSREDPTRTAEVEALRLGWGPERFNARVREVPTVLRTGLYAIPALVGATIVVVASESGSHNLAVPIVAAAVCFLIRLAGIHFDLNMPRAFGSRTGDGSNSGDER